jgi:hypothetical protein
MDKSIMDMAINILNGKIEQENAVLEWLYLIPTMTTEKQEQIVRANARIAILKETLEEIELIE